MRRSRVAWCAFGQDETGWAGGREHTHEGGVIAGGCRARLSLLPGHEADGLLDSPMGEACVDGTTLRDTVAGRTRVTRCDGRTVDA